MSLISNDVYVVDDFELQPSRRLLTRNGMRVSLAPKAFDVLLYLVQNAGRVVLKEELLRNVWPDTFVEEGNLPQHIFWVRKALSDKGVYIVTIPGRGYEFTGKTRLVPDSTTKENSIPADTSSSARVGITIHRSTERIQVVTEELSTQVPIRKWKYGRSFSQFSTRSRLLLPIALCACGLAALNAAFSAHVHRSSIAVTETKRLTADGYVKKTGAGPSPIIPVGSFLYFTEIRANRSVLARVPVTGGEVTTSTPPFPDAEFVDYSAPQQALLIGSAWRTDDDRPILVEKPVGSTPVQLGELTGHDASFSPDGSMIAFAKGRFLYIAMSDGSNVHLVADSQGVIYQPRWSPDGRALRFSQSLGSMQKQLWEVAPDGSNSHQLFLDRDDKDEVCCGNWTQDGRYYFYLSGSAPADSLWAIPTGNAWWSFGKPKPLKVNAGIADMWRSPVPSADGRHLFVIGEHLETELMRLDPISRRPQEYLGGVSAEGVSFSPDGIWICYTSYPEGSLWLSKRDGSEKRRLTDPPLISRFPKWSPDGRTIVFLAGKANTKWRLYLLSLSDGSVRPLLQQEEANEGTASWSPDGKKIAFGRLLSYGTERDPNLTIEIVDLDHGTSTTLHGSMGLWTPRWSPDGRYFAAVTQNNRTLKLYDTGSNLWTDIANLGINDVVWSPDSRFIFFDTSLGTAPSLYRVRVADHTMEKWADLSDIPRGGFFSPWLGMSPEGDPVFLRDKSLREIYQLSLDY